MKNTHFLTYLSALFLLCSLTSCYEQVYTYTTINKTSVPIKLKACRGSVDEPLKTISVDPWEEFTEEHIEKDPSSPYYSYKYFKNPQFLEVIYNNEKKEIFIDPDYLERPMINPLDSLTASYMDTIRVKSEKNPLNIFYYDTYEVTFLFIEEDYENATDCGGDCE
mgnify:CR=1 FL=1